MLECINKEMIVEIMKTIDEVFEKKIKGVEAPFFWIREGKHELLDVSRNAYNIFINVYFIIINE